MIIETQMMRKKIKVMMTSILIDDEAANAKDKNKNYEE